MIVTAFAFALLATAPLAGVPPPAPELAAQPLAAGHAGQAIATLEQASIADPHDAAVLINLGIAYAQAGNDAKARAAFQQALACHEVVEVDTADGSSTDSRRLARKALKMLDRGEFRPATARTDQLTYRN